MVSISYKHPKVNKLALRAKAIGMQINVKWIKGYKYIVFHCDTEQEHKINQYLKRSTLN